MRQRAKILIVDDEPFNVDYLEQELEDFGYGTISARNGQEVLGKVATENSDLILLDIMMPLMDGFTVCRTLKENDDTRLIPIVMMTAFGSVEDCIKGIEAGAEIFSPNRSTSASSRRVCKPPSGSKPPWTANSGSCGALKTTSPSSCPRPSSAWWRPIPRRQNSPNGSARSRCCSSTSAAIRASVNV